jgi:formylglycine-generating enzyme required for sulfatase activity
LGEDEFGLYAEFEVQGVAQRCCWMASGSFRMGSPESEGGRDTDEGPQHEVTLSGYWLADTACTQALWFAVMGDNPSECKDDLENPVESVSWDDCREFFEKLNRLVPDLRAGFPSEAQWEYACRAGTTTAYSFGNEIAHDQAHFGQDWDKGKTLPVASLPANPWGLYEMHGNVWEWCSDWFGSYEAELQADPEGPSQGRSRVLRGGSWFYDARDARSAYRIVHDPGFRFRYFGLRVAPGRAGPAEPA